MDFGKEYIESRRPPLNVDLATSWTSEARDHCRRRVLMWFESHYWEYLESKYLNNGERSIDVAKKDLKLVLLEAMSGDKFAKDRQKPNYQEWIENQVTNTIYNSMVAYVQVYGVRREPVTGLGLGSRSFCI